ncbi:DedA family protein [Bacillus sp. FJAT-45350]|uniref:DedA family protein n=1 Tax=Bacillus sp. FJAT-45350 TaxID=2011014 RepID=UPI000BB9796C|nr:DedA family protein [Bacillus sp. FJAT-45350]
MEYLEYLITTYGYIGIVFMMMGGIIGFPIPDEVLLTLIGYYLYKGKLTYFLSFSSAYAGAILGISLSYFLGSKLGLPFLEKYGPKINISHKRIWNSQALFHTYGPFLLFIGFFIPGLRHITGYLSGIAKYPLWKFALFSYTGALVWVYLFIRIGQELGNHFIIEDYIQRYSYYLGGILLLIVFGLIIRYLLSSKKKRH